MSVLAEPPLITRRQYMDGLKEFDIHYEAGKRRELSDRYYLQFANPLMYKYILNHIGLVRLFSFKTDTLSEMPIKKWDLLANRDVLMRHCLCLDKIADANEGNSPATHVCILKAVARDIIDNRPDLRLIAAVERQEQEARRGTSWRGG